MSERETALKEPCPHCGRTDYRWTDEFRVGLSFSPEDRLEVRCDYCRPLRMDAYYFGFSETGVRAIDRILSAVAHAGKGYHHTESWGDEGLDDLGEFRGGSYVAWIQNAANDAAKQFTGADPVPVCQWREIVAEVERATKKFPTWPTDPLHALAVLGEEFGELTKAVVQQTYEPHKNAPGELRKEAIQTAAMALRFVLSLDAYQPAPSVQHEQALVPAEGEKA